MIIGWQLAGHFFILGKPNDQVWSIDPATAPATRLLDQDNNLTRLERSLKFAKYGMVSKNKIRKIFKNLPNMDKFSNKIRKIFKNLPNMDKFSKKYLDKFSKKNIDKFSKKIYGQISKKIYWQIKLAPHWLAGWLAGSSLADV